MLSHAGWTCYYFALWFDSFNLNPFPKQSVVFTALKQTIQSCTFLLYLFSLSTTVECKMECSTIVLYSMYLYFTISGMDRDLLSFCRQLFSLVSNISCKLVKGAFCVHLCGHSDWVRLHDKVTWMRLTFSNYNTVSVANKAVWPHLLCLENCMYTVVCTLYTLSKRQNILCPTHSYHRLFHHFPRSFMGRSIVTDPDISGVSLPLMALYSIHGQIVTYSLPGDAV